jgi:hypothetical protein
VCVEETRRLVIGGEHEHLDYLLLPWAMETMEILRYRAALSAKRANQNPGRTQVDMKMVEEAEAEVAVLAKRRHAKVRTRGLVEGETNPRRVISRYLGARPP